MQKKKKLVRSFSSFSHYSLSFIIKFFYFSHLELRYWLVAPPIFFLSSSQYIPHVSGRFVYITFHSGVLDKYVSGWFWGFRSFLLNVNGQSCKYLEGGSNKEAWMITFWLKMGYFDDNHLKPINHCMHGHNYHISIYNYELFNCL